MLRRISEDIKSCDECPYNQYDHHYGMTYDSGFDCNIGARKVEDNEITYFDKKIKEWEESQLTLFPLPESDKPVNPMTKRFETECPLECVS